jgi:hypothetical protein
MSLLLNEKQRAAIEKLAEQRETSLGEITRDLIERGLAASGLKD